MDNYQKWLAEPFDLHDFWERELVPTTGLHNSIRKVSRDTLKAMDAKNVDEQTIDCLTDFIIDHFIETVAPKKSFPNNRSARGYLNKVKKAWSRSFALYALEHETYDSTRHVQMSETQIARRLGFVVKGDRDESGKLQYTPIRNNKGSYVKPNEIDASAYPNLLFDEEPYQRDESYDEWAYLHDYHERYAEELSDPDSQYEGIWFDDFDDGSWCSDGARQEGRDPWDGFGKSVDGRHWTSLDDFELELGYPARITLDLEAVERPEPERITEEQELQADEISRAVVDSYAATIPVGSNSGPYEIQKRVEMVNDLRMEIKRGVIALHNMGYWDELKPKERMTLVTTIAFSQLRNGDLELDDIAVRTAVSNTLGISIDALRKRLDRTTEKLSEL